MKEFIFNIFIIFDFFFFMLNFNFFFLLLLLHASKESRALLRARGLHGRRAFLLYTSLLRHAPK